TGKQSKTQMRHGIWLSCVSGRPCVQSISEAVHHGSPQCSPGCQEVSNPPNGRRSWVTPLMGTLLVHALCAVPLPRAWVPGTPRPGRPRVPREVQRVPLRVTLREVTHVPSRPLKTRVKQTISAGRRLKKIENLMDMAESMLEVKIEEARSGGAELPKKRKRRPKFTKWAQKTPSDEYEGAYGEITELGGQIARWLPDVLMGDGIWKEPLVSDDLAMLFDAFSPDLETELAPVVVYALQKALKKAPLPEVTIILEAMATARHSYDEAYKELGQWGSQLCLDADDDEVAEFGFALARATQRIPKQCQLMLKEGLQVHLTQLPGGKVRLMAWAAEEAGAKLQLWGEPPKEVEPDLAEHIWNTCSTLASSSDSRTRNARLRAGWPLPIVEVSSILTSEQLESLITLANTQDLWRPSARRGADHPEAGQALPGVPWTALLSAPERRTAPAAEAMRRWVAEAFGAPKEHVEAVRLIRYRQGEAASVARSDARPPEDTSLWLSGQRLAVVMLQLNQPNAVPGDGLTDFPNLEEGRGLQLSLTRGSALIWPTVNQDGTPTELAQRRALPLKTPGQVKYLALTWLRVGPAPGESGGAPA
ncbi:unnamed protein product, partial [Durusdinium trenchii]